MRNMAHTVILNAIFFKIISILRRKGKKDSKIEADNIDKKHGEVEKATLLPCS